jgi:hypothetical protein
MNEPLRFGVLFLWLQETQDAKIYLGCHRGIFPCRRYRAFGERSHGGFGQ